MSDKREDKKQFKTIYCKLIPIVKNELNVLGTLMSEDTLLLKRLNHGYLRLTALREYSKKVKNVVFYNGDVNKIRINDAPVPSRGNPGSSSTSCSQSMDVDESGSRGNTSVIVSPNESSSLSTSLPSDGNLGLSSVPEKTSAKDDIDEEIPSTSGNHKMNNNLNRIDSGKLKAVSGAKGQQSQNRVISPSFNLIQPINPDKPFEFSDDSESGDTENKSTTINSNVVVKNDGETNSKFPTESLPGEDKSSSIGSALNATSQTIEKTNNLAVSKSRDNSLRPPPSDKSFILTDIEALPSVVKTSAGDLDASAVSATDAVSPTILSDKIDIYTDRIFDQHLEDVESSLENTKNSRTSEFNINLESVIKVSDRCAKIQPGKKSCTSAELHSSEVSHGNDSVSASSGEDSKLNLGDTTANAAKDDAPNDKVQYQNKSSNEESSVSSCAKPESFNIESDVPQNVTSNVNQLCLSGAGDKEANKPDSGDQNVLSNAKDNSKRTPQSKFAVIRSHDDVSTSPQAEIDDDKSLLDLGDSSNVTDQCAPTDNAIASCRTKLKSNRKGCAKDIPDLHPITQGPIVEDTSNTNSTLEIVPCTNASEEISGPSVIHNNISILNAKVRHSLKRNPLVPDMSKSSVDKSTCKSNTVATLNTQTPISGSKTSFKKTIILSKDTSTEKAVIRESFNKNVSEPNSNIPNPPGVNLIPSKHDQVLDGSNVPNANEIYEDLSHAKTVSIEFSNQSINNESSPDSKLMHEKSEKLNLAIHGVVSEQNNIVAMENSKHSENASSPVTHCKNKNKQLSSISNLPAMTPETSYPKKSVSRTFGSKFCPPLTVSNSAHLKTIASNMSEPIKDVLGSKSSDLKKIVSKNSAEKTNDLKDAAVQSIDNNNTDTNVIVFKVTDFETNSVKTSANQETQTAMVDNDFDAEQNLTKSADQEKISNTAIPKMINLSSSCTKAITPNSHNPETTVTNIANQIATLDKIIVPNLILNKETFNNNTIVFNPSTSNIEVSNVANSDPINNSPSCSFNTDSKCVSVVDVKNPVSTNVKDLINLEQNLPNIANVSAINMHIIDEKNLCKNQNPRAAIDNTPGENAPKPNENVKPDLNLSSVVGKPINLNSVVAKTSNLEKMDNSNTNKFVNENSPHLNKCLNKTPDANEVVKFINFEIDSNEHYDPSHVVIFTDSPKIPSSQISAYADIEEVPLLKLFEMAKPIKPQPMDEIIRRKSGCKRSLSARTYASKRFCLSKDNAMNPSISSSKAFCQRLPNTLDIQNATDFQQINSDSYSTFESLLRPIKYTDNNYFLEFEDQLSKIVFDSSDYQPILTNEDCTAVRTKTDDNPFIKSLVEHGSAQSDESSENSTFNLPSTSSNSLGRVRTMGKTSRKGKLRTLNEKSTLQKNNDKVTVVAVDCMKVFYDKNKLFSSNDNWCSQRYSSSATLSEDTLGITDNTVEKDESIEDNEDESALRGKSFNDDTSKIEENLMDEVTLPLDENIVIQENLEKSDVCHSSDNALKMTTSISSTTFDKEVPSSGSTADKIIVPFNNNSINKKPSFLVENMADNKEFLLLKQIASKAVSSLGKNKSKNSDPSNENAMASTTLSKNVESKNDEKPKQNLIFEDASSKKEGIVINILEKDVKQTNQKNDENKNLPLAVENTAVDNKCSNEEPTRLDSINVKPNELSSLSIENVPSKKDLLNVFIEKTEVDVSLEENLPLRTNKYSVCEQLKANVSDVACVGSSTVTARTEISMDDSVVDCIDIIGGGSNFCVQNLEHTGDINLEPPTNIDCSGKGDCSSSNIVENSSVQVVLKSMLKKGKGSKQKRVRFNLPDDYHVDDAKIVSAKINSPKVVKTTPKKIFRSAIPCVKDVVLKNVNTLGSIKTFKKVNLVCSNEKSHIGSIRETSSTPIVNVNVQKEPQNEAVIHIKPNSLPSADLSDTHTIFKIEEIECFEIRNSDKSDDKSESKLDDNDDGPEKPVLKCHYCKFKTKYKTSILRHICAKHFMEMGLPDKLHMVPKKKYKVIKSNKLNLKIIKRAKKHKRKNPNDKMINKTGRNLNEVGTEDTNKRGIKRRDGNDTFLKNQSNNLKKPKIESWQVESIVSGLCQNIISSETLDPPNNSANNVKIGFRSKSAKFDVPSMEIQSEKIECDDNPNYKICCIRCNDQVCYTEKQLKLHMIESHDKIPGSQIKLVCSICFSTFDDLATHMKMNHSDATFNIQPSSLFG